MRKKMLLAVAVLLSFNTLFAQAEGGQGQMRRDPKQMTARMAEKLNFTADQNAKLTALNDKYKTEDYDRMKYRDEFQGILTDAQKQQMADMRKARMSQKEAGGQN